MRYFFCDEKGLTGVYGVRDGDFKTIYESVIIKKIRESENEVDYDMSIKFSII